MVFRWTIRILFIDTDASGRIHYTAMFRYFEAAEIEFFRSIDSNHVYTEMGFPRVHVECDYRSAIRCDDQLVIEVSVGRVGNASIQLKFRALNDELEVAEGKVIIAAMDRTTQRATAIPPALRERLHPYITT
jgi:YbgC/YbaW family acyl-CoA thioester hydrolase